MKLLCIFFLVSGASLAAAHRLRAAAVTDKCKEEIYSIWSETGGISPYDAERRFAPEICDGSFSDVTLSCIVEMSKLISKNDFLKGKNPTFVPKAMMNGVTLCKENPKVLGLCVKVTGNFLAKYGWGGASQPEITEKICTKAAQMPNSPPDNYAECLERGLKFSSPDAGQSSYYYRDILEAAAYFCFDMSLS
uniref:Uncharacterized protein n=1 Tax=Chromera velia CCMP2878 TaxID=1169474 RepID=A0A0G4GQQ4_9ALVE|eukprot:Cvel_22903.t1-p1 / transcript=Cvel_22903.t1 / gene=Cvel_22903 / organism=Chromera_velia_CCMP2878 / gene_product=hypothetical protein / transcript_product=hypothetical protein / location=Cvel_scaffold2301:22438-23466(+) / protein_length=191 / sequence_SO=supercontig / SO=protein_coding / is_pseudo=false